MKTLELYYDETSKAEFRRELEKVAFMEGRAKQSWAEQEARYRGGRLPKNGSISLQSVVDEDGTHYETVTFAVDSVQVTDDEIWLSGREFKFSFTKMVRDLKELIGSN